MKRLAILVVLASCAGKVPETRYYQLAEPSGKASSGNGVAIVIQPLETESAYDDERIVYRVTPYRLDYYNYHRWSASPGALIANYLERAFEKSGRFGAVTRTENPEAAVALSGRVIAIEEVDQTKDRWIGRVVLELTLTDTSTGDILWAEQYEETEPLPVQSPEGLARALSVALERIARRAVPVVSITAEKAARARDAGVSPSRAARLKP